MVREQIVRGWTKIAAGGKWRLRVADTRGQAMVEIALVLPFVAILMVGAVQFGIALKDLMQNTDAARVGARVAAVARFKSNYGPSCSKIEQAAKDALAQQGFSPDDVDVTYPDANCDPGSPVKVTVDEGKSKTISVPFLDFLPVDIGISSDATETLQ